MEGAREHLVHSMLSWLDRDCIEDGLFRAETDTRENFDKLFRFIDRWYVRNGHCKLCFSMFYISFAEILNNSSCFTLENLARLENTFDKLAQEFIVCIARHKHIVRYCSLHYYSYLEQMYKLLAYDNIPITRPVSAKLFKLFDRLVTVFYHCVYKGRKHVKCKRRNSI